MLYPRNPFFTGREAILQQLRDSLTQTGRTALIQAIRGLGGIGKTQTALEYAYRYQADYAAVLWAQADAETTLDTEYSRIARLLDLPEKDATEAEVVREGVKRWLATHDNYLLVLDNADDPMFLRNFLPPNPQGHILLTSRAHNFVKLNVGKALELEVLSESEAVAFLLHRTDREAGSAEELTAAQALAEELGRLPLALEQAAAYIANMGALSSVYLVSYRKRKLKALEMQPPEAGEYQKTVATTWSLNIEQVRKRSEASAELLNVCAFLAPDRIPLEIFVNGASKLGDTLTNALEGVQEDLLILDELLQPLTDYSLIRREVEAFTIDVHRLVQAVVQASILVEGQRTYRERVVGALAASHPGYEFEKWSLCERLLPHQQACAEQIKQHGIDIPPLF